MKAQLPGATLALVRGLIAKGLPVSWRKSKHLADPTEVATAMAVIARGAERSHLSHAPRFIRHPHAGCAEVTKTASGEAAVSAWPVEQCGASLRVRSCREDFHWEPARAGRKSHRGRE